MNRGQVILVDTNVIIESVRVSCWSTLKAHFSMETVDKCCEEARSGERRRPNYVVVDEDALRVGVKIHPVSARELAMLAVHNPYSERLDLGELHLWADARTRGDAWLASSADHAAVCSAARLGWIDRLVSLEELARTAGAHQAAGKLKDQFSTARRTRVPAPGPRSRENRSSRSS